MFSQSCPTSAMAAELARAENAALIAPAEVPHIRSYGGPFASISLNNHFRTPASYAPRAPAPLNTSARFGAFGLSGGGSGNHGGSAAFAGAAAPAVAPNKPSMARKLERETFMVPSKNRGVRRRIRD